MFQMRQQLNNQVQTLWYYSTIENKYLVTPPDIIRAKCRKGPWPGTGQGVVRCSIYKVVRWPTGTLIAGPGCLGCPGYTGTTTINFANFDRILVLVLVTSVGHVRGPNCLANEKNNVFTNFSNLSFLVQQKGNCWVMELFYISAT